MYRQRNRPEDFMVATKFINASGALEETKIKQWCLDAARAISADESVTIKAVETMRDIAYANSVYSVQKHCKIESEVFFEESAMWGTVIAIRNGFFE